MFFLSYLAIFLIGRCFKKQLVYALPIIFAYLEFQSCYREHVKEEQASLGNGVWLTFWVTYFCILLAPSIMHTVAYIVIYLMSAVYKIIKHFDGNGKEKAEIMIYAVIVGAVASFIAFYVL